MQESSSLRFSGLWLDVISADKGISIISKFNRADLELALERKWAGIVTHDELFVYRYMTDTVDRNMSLYETRPDTTSSLIEI